jgi:type IV pilus assembly protein PilC
MPKYFYTAQSLDGKKKSGTLEAKNVRYLSQDLRADGFILIKAETEKTKGKKLKISLPFNKVSLTDRMFFVRNLQIMIATGLPLPRAINSLAKQTKNEKFKTALFDINQDVTKGMPFSIALGRFPEIFSELFQNMIKVGEESGTLDQVLQTLSMQMEKESTLKSRIQGAMIYPSVVVSAMLGVGLLMLVTVIPTLSDTFVELGIELPATTQSIINLGNFLSQNWLAVILSIPFLIIFSLQMTKKESVKKIIDKLFLKIPIVSQIVKSSNSAYMLRTLSSLIIAGVSLPRALEITSGVLGNFYFKKSIIEASEKVRKGKKLSEVLENYQEVYPRIVIQMITVGEETGETSTILSKLADFFEEEVSNATKNLASVVEPFLMLIIGGVIGFFAISMIQPMYSMLGSID